MYILHENEPYFYNVAEEKVYACDITHEGIKCDFKSSMKAPKEINCGYTHSEITALLAERIANATVAEAPKARSRKSKVADIED